MPASKNPRNRPVIRAAGAPRLLPEKIFSVPLRLEAAPPALPLFPVNFIPPLLPEKNFSRLFTGTAAARRERYSEPFRLKIAGADSPGHNRPPSVWRQYLPGKSASADNRSRPPSVQPCKGKINQPESTPFLIAAPASVNALIPPRAFQRRYFPGSAAPFRCSP